MSRCRLLSLLSNLQRWLGLEITVMIPHPDGVGWEMGYEYVFIYCFGNGLAYFKPAAALQLWVKLCFYCWMLDTSFVHLHSYEFIHELIKLLSYYVLLKSLFPSYCAG
jgi:hypothetical protein